MALVSKGATLSAGKSRLDREERKSSRIGRDRRVLVEWNGHEVWILQINLADALQRGARIA